jgi:hypothetical protein
VSTISYNLSGPPVLIYSSPPSGRGHVTVVSTSTAPVYVSSNASAGTGAAMLVQQDGMLSIPNAASSLYAQSGNALTFTTPATSLSADAAAGAGTVVVASVTGFSTPATIALGNGTGLEWCTFSSYPGGGTAVLASATVFDHNSGATVRTLSTQVPSPLTVTIGVS